LLQFYRISCVIDPGQHEFRRLFKNSWLAIRTSQPI
jgi:hypothetical protein